MPNYATQATELVCVSGHWQHIRLVTNPASDANKLTRRNRQVDITLAIGPKQNMITLAAHADIRLL